MGGTPRNAPAGVRNRVPTVPGLRVTDRAKRHLARFWMVYSFALLPLLPAIYAASKYLPGGWDPMHRSLASVAFVALLMIVFLRIVTPRQTLFEHVHFGSLTPEAVREAALGVINGEKAQEFFVHAAPRPMETDDVLAKLERDGFAFVSGRTGTGKSTAAYHAAHDLSQRHFRVYRLNVDNPKLHGARPPSELVVSYSELDNLKDWKRLVIVDDAHKIPHKDELRSALEREANSRSQRFIWIETEEEPNDAGPCVVDSEGIHISAAANLDAIVEQFYRSENPTLKSLLAESTAGLADALERARAGKVMDLWHFNFIATGGWERLAGQMEKLDKSELLVLFLVSGHTLISGEMELHRDEVAKLVKDLDFVWLGGKESPQWVYEAVARLASSDIKLIRVYARGKEQGYVQSLHINSARQIVKLCLEYEGLASNLLSAARRLLPDDFSKCNYLGWFCRALDVFAGRFLHDSEDWLTKFLQEPMPEHLKGYARTLTALKWSAPDVYATVTHNLADSNSTLDSMAARFSLASAATFQPLATALRHLGPARARIIEQLRIEPLSRTTIAYADSVTGGPSVADQRPPRGGAWLTQLAMVLAELGSRRGELLGLLGVPRLVALANSVGPDNWQSLADLLCQLDYRRADVLRDLKVAKLGELANSAGPDHWQSLAYLLKQLGSRRMEVLEDLEVPRLAVLASSVGPDNWPSLVHLLHQLDYRCKEAVRSLDVRMLARNANTVRDASQLADLGQLLHVLKERRAELVSSLDFAHLARVASMADASQADRIAQLIAGLGTDSHRLTEHEDLDVRMLVVRMLNSVSTENMGQVAHLVKALGTRAEELLAEPSSRNPILLDGLALTVSGVTSERFHDAAEILDAIGSLRVAILPKLDYNKLMTVAEAVRASDILGLVWFLRLLAEPDREPFVLRLDWRRHCLELTSCHNHIYLAYALRNLARQHELIEGLDVAEVISRLQSEQDAILSKLLIRHPGMYWQAATFLLAYVSLAPEPGRELAGLLADRVVASGVITHAPWWSGLAALISALSKIEPALAERFLRNNKVRGRIIQGIDEESTATEHVAGLELLIKAICGADPSQWLEWLEHGWITADLSMLDLDTLYKEAEATDVDNAPDVPEDASDEPTTATTAREQTG
jgi:hypothetical protein